MSLLSRATGWSGVHFKLKIDNPRFKRNEKHLLEDHLFHQISFQQMTDLPVALSSQLVDKYFQMPGVFSLFSSTDSIRCVMI